MSALVDYIVTSSWNGGFVMEISVTNTGTTKIYDYMVGFTLPGAITSVWNGVITAKSGDAYVIMDDDDKNDIAVDETITFKIKVETTREIEPANFTINGELAEVALRPDDTPGAFVDGVASVGPDITAAELQLLLDKAPEGGLIKLAAGDYVFDAALRITRSDVSLTGAGAGKTTVTFTDAALDDGPAIHVAGTRTVAAGSLAADAAEGATKLALGSGHGLWVGDTVRLYQNNSTAFLDAIGDTAWRQAEPALRTSMAKVIAVDGNTVTLDRGIHFAFDAHSARIERIDTVDDVTVQGFTVKFQLGTADATDFSNVLPHLDRYRAVEFDGTWRGELTDVDVLNGPSVAFEVSRSLDITVHDIAARGAFNKGDGGNGYAYELRESYDGTFTKLQDADMRHSVVFASWASSVDNRIHLDFTDRDVNFHGGRDHGNHVHVEKSMREAAADDLSTTVWINQGGETFGAPTDPEANAVFFDYVIGSRRGDLVQGVDSGVYFDGKGGDDTLIGGAGNDTLAGGRNDDVIDGNDGYDVALFDKPFAAYAIGHDAQGRVLVDGYADDDVLVDVEKAVFSDGVAVDLRTLAVSQGPVPVRPTSDQVVPTADVFFPASDPVKEPPFTVAVETLSRWSSGWVMAVDVTNTGATTVADPKVSFTLPVPLAELKGARVVSQSDGAIMVADDRAGSLAPGETFRFTFKAYAPVTHVPQDVTVDGVATPVGPQMPSTGAPALVASSGEAMDADSLTTVSSAITSSWSSGYVTQVTVRNVSDVPIAQAALTFDLDVKIDTLWNGVVTSSGSGRYTVTDDTAGAVLDPGASWTFKYKVYDATRPLPANTQVDGVADLGLAGVGMPAATRTGTSASEVVTGSTGNDVLHGGTGADTLEGGLGDDIYRINSDGDEAVEIGGGGRDVIDTTVSRALELEVEVLRATGTGSLKLTGNAQANILVGNDAPNVLTGGLGMDALEGNGGADVFAYLSTLDSRPDAPDVVADFSRAEGDRIDLSAIDTNPLVDGDQVFSWIGTGGFSGEAGQVRKEGDLVQVDVDGDGVVDMAIKVTGVTDLTGWDFLL